EDQGGNVASIHIGITHDHDLVIPQFFQVQRLAVLLGTYCHTKRSVNILDLFVFKDLMRHCLFHVQDLPSQGQDRLKMTVSSRFGGTSRRISLNKEYFTFLCVLRSTIRQLSWQASPAHYGLSLHHLTSLLGCMSCLCSKDNLLDDSSGIVRMLFKVILKHFRNRLRNSR